MSAGVIGVILGFVLGGAAGFAVGARCGMDAMQKILIRAFGMLDDEDTLTVRLIKEVIGGEEDSV